MKGPSALGHGSLVQRLFSMQSTRKVFHLQHYDYNSMHEITVMKVMQNEFCNIFSILSVCERSFLALNLLEALQKE